MATKTQTNAITRNQITTIKIRQKELGLDDDTYRDFLEGVTGKRSCTELSFDEARRVIGKLAEVSKPKTKMLREPQHDKRGQKGKFAGAHRPPSDGGETITERQQETIEAFREYMGWDEKKMRIHCKKICKSWWPQTSAHGVKLVVNLIVINAEMILRNIRNLDKSQLSRWEKEFLYFNNPNALDEFARYTANKNKRGSRTMPGCSMLKLLEILKKRPQKPLGVVPVKPANDKEG